MYCAGCQARLVEKHTEHESFLHCPRCHARAMQLAGLAMTPRSKAALALREALQEQHILPGGPPCPHCAERMTMMPMPGDDVPAAAQVGVCRACEMVWFNSQSVPFLDSPELDVPWIPHAMESPECELPQEIRMALTGAENGNKWYAVPKTWQPPEHSWKVILALLGYPVEAEVKVARPSIPWMVFSFVVLIGVISITAFIGYPHALTSYGFVPAHAWRSYGLTLLTAPFLHGNWITLVSNLLVLLLFGKSIERRYGSGRFLLLFLVGALLGNLSYYITNTGSHVPCTGASSGIAGLLLLYALTFPGARFAYCIYFLFRGFRWIRVPAVLLVTLWFGWQAIMAYYHLAGHTSTAIFPYLGGMVTGIACWLLWHTNVVSHHELTSTRPAKNFVFMKRKISHAVRR